MSWNNGYYVGVDYTQGYFSQLSPQNIDFALLNKRLARREGPLRYLELGFGHGLSLNVHAAGRTGEFWGTDFTPGHAASAQALAREAGSDVRILGASFGDLLDHDLPEFDIIALHGVWSWVSPEVQRSILQLVDKRLAVGGALYLSYNCQPGWAAMLPLQRMIAQHAGLDGTGAVRARVDAALDTLDELAAAGGRFFTVHPQMREFIKSLRTKDARYIAHEFLQANLTCYTFAEVAGQMAQSRLAFGASALLLDHIPGVHVTPAGSTALAKIGDPILRETARDYLVNAQFRCDLYVKGATTLSPFQQRTRMAATGVVLTAPAADVKLEMTGGLGQITLKHEIYKPLLEVLASRAHAPKTIGELSQHPDLQGLPADHILEACTVLVGLTVLCPTQSAAEIEAARPRCRALNRALRTRAEVTDEGMTLASPVTGMGVGVPQIYQYFMTAEEKGITAREDVILFVHKLIRRDDPLRPHAGGMPVDPALVTSLGLDLDNYRKRVPLYKALELI